MIGSVSEEAVPLTPLDVNDLLQSLGTQRSHSFSIWWWAVQLGTALARALRQRSRDSVFENTFSSYKALSTPWYTRSSPEAATATSRQTKCYSCQHAADMSCRVRHGVLDKGGLDCILAA